MDSPTPLGKWPYKRYVNLAISLMEARPYFKYSDDFVPNLNFYLRKRFLLLFLRT